jgi:hypothetical protein
MLERLAVCCEVVKTPFTRVLRAVQCSGAIFLVKFHEEINDPLISPCNKDSQQLQPVGHHCAIDRCSVSWNTLPSTTHARAYKWLYRCLHRAVGGT